jgi:hypothetical protein
MKRVCVALSFCRLLKITHGRGPATVPCAYKADTMGADFKPRSLTNRANPKAENIATPGVERRRWVVAEGN